MVLGKLAATSITGFYGLLAVLPVLAVPLLVGGVTSAEFWRMVVVLVNTCLFSLAIGIFGSTVCRDRRSAMAVNLLLLLAFAGGPRRLFGAARMYFSPLPHSGTGAGFVHVPAVFVRAVLGRGPRAARG